jgi:titin
MVGFRKAAAPAFPPKSRFFLPIRLKYLPASILFIIFSVLGMAAKTGAATWSVTNTADSGAGSLRQAIVSANTNPGPDTIIFSIPGSGVKIIMPFTALPPINDNNTTIDGYTQYGASEATAIAPAVLRVLIGGGLTAASAGLSITSSGNIVRGLVINNFDIHGIAITGIGAFGNIISGNYIGTESTGNADQGNGGNGIYIASRASGNVIGGSSPADRNVISGNNQSGILIDGTGTDTNTVSGNYIGVNVGGTAPLPNSLDGIRITGGAQHNHIGGDTPGERNVISGNMQYGIQMTGTETGSNVIQGNYIGLSSQGFGGIGNQILGILLQNGSNQNLIGGADPGEGNTVSGNAACGIYLYNAVSNYLSGNFIGTSPDGGSARGNTYGLYLVGTSSGNVIGGDAPGQGNIISGNTIMGISLEADANTIQGNTIGLAADGLTPLPNRTGIYLAKSNNTIGGTLPAHRNIISGNLDEGILIGALEFDPLDASNNVISGNYIGTDRSGTTAVGNQYGLFLGPRAANNTIGGATSGSANVISGNQHGIWLEGGPDICRFYHITGNYIGTDYRGIGPLGNQNDGIHFSQVAQRNIVGPNNIIAYNGGDGVGVDTGTAIRNTILGNSIYANVGLGINLTNGSNNGVLAPTIQSTTFGSIRIAVTACADCAVHVYSSRLPEGEGQIFLGGGTSDGAGHYVLEVSAIPYAYLTATATTPLGSTSEFSPVFVSTAFQMYLPLVLR